MVLGLGLRLRLGLGMGGHCAGATGWFNGYVDEVATWNTALSTAAITSIYNNGTPIDLANSGNYNGYTSNLKGYWRFSEGNGTTAYDISGRGNHGTLTNGPPTLPGSN